MSYGWRSPKNVISPLQKLTKTKGVLIMLSFQKSRANAAGVCSEAKVRKEQATLVRIFHFNWVFIDTDFKISQRQHNSLILYLHSDRMRI